MIITIQKSTKGYTVTFIDSIVEVEFKHRSLQQVTKALGKYSDNYFKYMHERPTIKILPITHTPMATKKTYPAKKKAVVAKKKVVAKGKKK